MPRWDFECKDCGNLVEVSFPDLERADTTPVYCRHCHSGTPMMRLPAAPSFTIRGFSAKNGYAQ